MSRLPLRGSFRIALLLSLALLPFVGCEQPTLPELPPTQVTTTQPLIASVPRQKIFVGYTEAENDVTLRARVTGFLDEVKFEGGDMVTKGQELFVIEQAPFTFRKDQAEALLEKADAELKLAEGNYRRGIEAHKGGGITDEELAERQAQYYQAKAVKADSQQSLALAKQELDYTVVKAPFDGEISRRLIDAGNLVIGTGEGTPLAQVTSIDPVYVYFNVPENLINMLRRKYQRTKLKPGEAKIAIMLDGEQDYGHEGWIDYVSTTIDRQTGTAQLRGVLPNAKHLLQPGQFARVKVFGEPITDALLVRDEAVSNDLRGHFMLTVNSAGVVEKKPVELGGLYMNNQMREVTPKPSALEAAEVEPFSKADWYVVRGLAKAWPGMKVVATQDAALGHPAEAAPTSSESKAPDTGEGEAPENREGEAADSSGAN